MYAYDLAHYRVGESSEPADKAKEFEVSPQRFFERRGERGREGMEGESHCLVTVRVILICTVSTY